MIGNANLHAQCTRFRSVAYIVLNIYHVRLDFTIGLLHYSDNDHCKLLRWNKENLLAQDLLGDA